MKTNQIEKKLEALCKIQTIQTVEQITKAVDRSYHPGMDKAELLTIITNSGKNRSELTDITDTVRLLKL